MTKLEATIADLTIAVSLTTEPGEDLLVPRERVTELLDEIERQRTVVREYVNEVESGEKFDALVRLVPGLMSDDGAYGCPSAPPCGDLCCRSRAEIHPREA